MKEKKKLINQLISESDDNIAASFISEFRYKMRDLPTVTKMKICYNLIAGTFRLFCVCGSRKNLESMAKDIHKGLLDEIAD
jgi:hypothetical protein